MDGMDGMDAEENKLLKKESWAANIASCHGAHNDKKKRESIREPQRNATKKKAPIPYLRRFKQQQQ